MGLAGFLFRMCLGHLSFTLRMLCGCVAGGLHLCLRLRGERGSHVCLCTCLHVPLGVSLSVPGGGAVDPPALFLSVGLCLCLSPGLRQPHTLCAGEGGSLLECVCFLCEWESGCPPVSICAREHAGECACMVWAPRECREVHSAYEGSRFLLNRHIAP